MTQPSPGTIIDLLDEFFAGTWGPESVEVLNHGEIFDLAESVDNYYSQFVIKPPSRKAIRQYSGGASFTHIHPGDTDTTLPIQARFAPSALLYADEVVIHCPLDRWICRDRGTFAVPAPYTGIDGTQLDLSQPKEINSPGFWRSGDLQNRDALRQALWIISRMEVGIRAGWILPVPHLRFWKKQENSIWTQVRRDIRDNKFQTVVSKDWKAAPASSDNVRGMQPHLNIPYIRQDRARALSEAPSLYFNGTMAIAELSESRFLPTTDSDYALLCHVSEKATYLDARMRDALLVSALDHTLAPKLTEDNIDTVFEIRANEEVFNSWRQGLEELTAGRTLLTSATLAENQTVVRDEIERLVDNIRITARRSTSLRSRLSQPRTEGGLDILFAATMLAVPSDVVTKILTLSAPIIKAGVRAFTSPLNGQASVVFQLDRAGVTSAVSSNVG